jgi:uncharacterized membrane protein YkvI
MIKAFKNAALYVGAIVGAGFASGSEIALFFDGQSVIVVAAAGLILGFFASAFVYIGKIMRTRNDGDNANGAGDFFDIFPKRYAVVLRAAFLISSFITLAAMTAGAERIFEISFDLKYVGIISLVTAVLLGFLNTEKLKSVFSALVLVVVGLIVVLFVGSGTGAGYGGFNFLKAISYSSMNVFLGGYLVAKRADAKKNEIVWTGIFSAVILTALLVMIYNINFKGSGDMPVISAAASFGRGKAAAVIVFFAVVSTAVSTAKTLLGFAKKRYGKAFSAAAIIACAYAVSLAGFNNIVEYTYPAISLFSSLFTVLTMIYLIRHIYGEKRTAVGALLSRDKPFQFAVRRLDDNIFDKAYLRRKKAEIEN